MAWYYNVIYSGIFNNLQPELLVKIGDAWTRSKSSCCRLLVP